MQDNGEGNVEIVRAESGRPNFEFLLLNNDLGKANTVLSSNARYDFTQRFGRYRCVSKQSTSGLSLAGSTLPVEDIVKSESPEIIDDEIDQARLLTIMAETSSSVEECQARIEWEANIRKARSRSYLPEVEEFADRDGIPLSINALYPVNDEPANISDTMLAESYRMTLDDGGSRTSFVMLNENAYTLELSEPVTKKKSSSLGDIFGANKERIVTGKR